MHIALANFVALLHFAFIAIFVFAIVLSVQGKLSQNKIIQAFFWLWLGGKILSYVLLNACIFTMTEQYLRGLAGVGYEEGYIAHYASQIGLELSDTTIAFLVVAPIVVGVISELYWQRRKKIGMFRSR